MSRTCEICGRGPLKGASRSHSNIKTLKRKYINLQTKKIEGKRIKICTSCLKNRAKSAKS
ncbi:MAG: 50S ribosomal protein L28 [Candidatus Buchananbacteria bacterium RBG_13_36_9]|uniref:Large ribosomal subunit protein bL28 n=1 Tax=Candidatus Buchananbacteria bacterium RBG_13_36_9 TaxID=1797530 RepID=A0A1G1XMZ4_9BACT|nr:MAG: 50S ribosomal protein L28 [Candidatus Buchananbacteria bacterium RBG_13_36_9]